MDWQDILLSFLLSGVIGVILKSAVEATFARELAQVQLDNSQHLARLNSQLARLQAVESTQYAELHQRRAAAILELYRLLVPAEEHLTFFGAPVPRIVGQEDKRSPSDRLQSMTRSFHEAVGPLLEFYKVNKILLSPAQEELMESIIAIFETLRTRVSMMAFNREFPSEDETERTQDEEYLQASLADARAKLKHVYPDLKAELESDFRATLGFGIEEKLQIAKPSEDSLSA
jgi:hypothetical protein